MSELSPLGTCNSDEKLRQGSIGPPLVSLTQQAKVVNEDGMICGPNEQQGELLIHSPQVMLGYLGEHEKTDKCLCTSGWWLCTSAGDVVHYVTKMDCWHYQLHQRTNQSTWVFSHTS